MDLKQLIERNPGRELERAVGGELEPGQLGIVSARHGAGKTPFLVGLSVDALLRGRNVLHVSLDMKTDHVRDFYDQIFNELASQNELDDAGAVHFSMERRRRIHAYLGGSFSLEKFSTSVSFMREHASFDPELILIDEYDFQHATAADISALVAVAAQAGSALWMTAVRHREEPITDPDGIAEPVARVKAQARIIIDLKASDSAVAISLLKPRPASGAGTLPIQLDPTSMLLRRR